MKTLLRIICMMVFLNACLKVDQKHFAVSGVATSTSTTTYTCSYYSTSTYTEYDSLSACQTATSANCNAETKTFPSGGTAICYRAVDGWETCAANPAYWIYSAWSTSWCDTGTMSGGNEVYKTFRSVVGCSSAICLCTAATTLSKTCTALVDCGTVGNAFFNPATTPTPAPCP